jgi:hypothetical protein
MQQFIEKYKDQIVGSLIGFDRVVFRGSRPRLVNASRSLLSNTAGIVSHENA